MTTEEVAKRQDGAIALPDEGALGLSGQFNRGDVSTPACSIVQPSSASDRGEAGNYWFPDGHTTERLEVVVLEIAGTRTLWAPKDTGETSPVCRSADRTEGLTNKPSMVLGEDVAKKQHMADGPGTYLVCDVCPHSNDDPFGSGDWLCKPGYTLLLYEEERGPFLFFAKGSAMKIVQRMIVSPALMRLRQKRPSAPWQTSFEWTLQLRENEKGKYYTPEIKALFQLKPEDAKRYEEMAMEMAGKMGERMEAAVQEEAEQAALD